MTRLQAFEELSVRLFNENLIKHSLAVEAVMRKLAEHFQEDIELWGIAGLLHDIDLERIDGNMDKHGIIGSDILEGLDIDPTIVYAVRAHVGDEEFPRRRKIDKALYCADPTAGLITACALLTPEKSLSALNAEFINRRFNEKGFAKGAKRENIRECEELDLSIENLFQISLDAMKTIHEQLGL